MLFGVRAEGWSCVSLPSSFIHVELWNRLHWIFVLIAYIRFLVAGVILVLITPILCHVCFWRNIPQSARPSSFTRFLDHTWRRTTVSRTPLDEWSARRRDLYVTTHNTHNRRTSMPPAGFEPTISGGEWLHTQTFDRVATGTSILCYIRGIKIGLNKISFTLGSKIIKFSFWSRLL